MYPNSYQISVQIPSRTLSILSDYQDDGMIDIYSQNSQLYGQNLLYTSGSTSTAVPTTVGTTTPTTTTNTTTTTDTATQDEQLNLLIQQLQSMLSTNINSNGQRLFSIGTNTNVVTPTASETETEMDEMTAVQTLIENAFYLDTFTEDQYTMFSSSDLNQALEDENASDDLKKAINVLLNNEDLFNELDRITNPNATAGNDRISLSDMKIYLNRHRTEAA